MARVSCHVCGKLVDTTKSNYIFANNLHQHKKCPKVKVLNDVERNLLQQLKDKIEYHWLNQNLSNYGLNWRLIGVQIKRLKDNGYSYKDQIFALDFVVNMDNGFWGYGRVEKFIKLAIEEKEKKENYYKNKEKTENIMKKNKKIKITSKPTFFDM